jgi:hypothetical protein
MPPAWAKEPIVHFLVFGALLFAAHRFLRPPAASHVSSDSHRIVVTRDYMQSVLREREARTGQDARQTDLRAVVDQFVDEEVLYREAIALGLDKNDMVVRRRLVQKMEFLSEDLRPLREPSETELAAALEAHRAEFSLPATVAFRHLYFSRDARGDHAQDDAHRTLASLSGADATGGDTFVGGQRFGPRTERDIASSFGGTFGAALFAAPTARWSGPFASTYGWHVVYVEQHVDERLPPLTEVRARVRERLLGEQRKQANEDALRAMRAKYSIVIEPGAIP